MDWETIGFFFRIGSGIFGLILGIAGAIAFVLNLRQILLKNKEDIDEHGLRITEGEKSHRILQSKLHDMETRPKCVDIKANCDEGRDREMLEIAKQIKGLEDRKRSDMVLISNQIHTAREESKEQFKELSVKIDDLAERTHKTAIEVARVEAKSNGNK